MGDNASQISSFRLVRTSAVKEHKFFKEEEKRIRCLFSQINQQCQHCSGNFHQYKGDHNPNHGSLYCNNQSVAESTLQHYGSGGQHGDNTSNGLPTRAGPDGRQYPFNPDDSAFLSIFEVGFRGCFKRGQSDHNRREQCPFGSSNSKEMLNAFYRDLKIHQPAFRKQSNEHDQVRMIPSTVIYVYSY